MPRRYWLFKSEPNAYSYDDLLRDGVAEWDGVRNFQARNTLREAPICNRDSHCGTQRIP
jgi:predicted RNA-binding protein with PUA-like domain